MTILTRDNILQVQDIQIELVDVPEWGGSVYVRGMNGIERDKFESSVIEIRGKSQRVNMENVRAKLAAFSICDEGGNRLFTESDVKLLSQKSAQALQRVFEVAQRLSGITDTAVNELTEELQTHPLEDSTFD